MFQRRKEVAKADPGSRTARRPTSFATTVLAEGSALEGKLTVRGALQVDGAVSGQLSCDALLSVGSTGRVLGEVRAEQLSVAGRAYEKVYARGHLVVRASGQVRGHARYASLEIERGGIMNASTSLAADYPESDQERDAAE